MDELKELRSMIYRTFRNAADMSRELGWGKQKLHRIVTGRQAPNVVDLYAMADALEVERPKLCDLFYCAAKKLEKKQN